MVTGGQLLPEFHGLERDQRDCLKRLFSEHQPSFLIDAVIEGHLGKAWVDGTSFEKLTWHLLGEF